MVKYDVKLEDETREVDVQEIEPGLYQVTVDGRQRRVDVRKSEYTVYSLLLDGKSYEATIDEENSGYSVLLHGSRYLLGVTDAKKRILDRARGTPKKGKQVLSAQMAGRVVKVLVSEGDDVHAGQGVVVIEAMKMENEIPATHEGKVTKVSIEAGQTVEAGQTLVVIE